jgi:hypothetical protein
MEKDKFILSLVKGIGISGFSILLAFMFLAFGIGNPVDGRVCFLTGFFIIVGAWAYERFFNYRRK